MTGRLPRVASFQQAGLFGATRCFIACPGRVAFVGFLTLSRMNPGESSGSARPSGPRWRLRGLPGPTALSAERQDLLGGVVVPMAARAAVRAAMPADRQTCLDQDAAARTRLAGVGRRHGAD